MWLTKLVVVVWLFSAGFFAFCPFLFGEVLFFAKLLDVYSYYEFDTPTLFACFVTSVDEELRCFFNCCLWWQGNSVKLLTQVHIPMQSLKWRHGGEKKLNRVFFCKIDSSVFKLMANSHLSFLLGFDGSETVHPPPFLQGVWDVYFILSDPVCCKSHL